MLYYVKLENKQVIELTQGELPLVAGDTVKGITEAEAQQIRQEGLRAFLYDTALRLKPLVTFALDKTSILADGKDTARLTVTVSGGNIAVLDMSFNGLAYNVKLTNGSASVPIVGTAKQVITIVADPNLFRFTPVTLEVT